MLFKTLWCALLSIAVANPFTGKRMYVNPTFQQNIDRTIASTTDSEVISTLKTIRDAPSAYWLDVKAKVQAESTSLDSMNGILRDAAGELVVFIVYDLPNRDCAARSSNGEICCSRNADGTCNYRTSDCAAGLREYRGEYIDKIAAIRAKYASTPVVFVIEPDSLPNLVTNLGNPNCGAAATQQAYKEGIKYAVGKLTAPNTHIYIDAAHGGWLGWENNYRGFQSLIQSMNILPQIRGFATNVANYQPLGVACPSAGWCLPHLGHGGDACCADACGVVLEYNSANNEHNYVLSLASLFKDKYFLIDTGRNGVVDARQDCANWCNPRGMGLGRYPTASTELPMVDAYLWLKTPGESDGCTQQLPSGSSCRRYDSMCASVDSIGSIASEPRAPEAGAWFDYQIKMLAKNADLGKVPSPTPSPTPTPKPTPVPTPTPPSGHPLYCPQLKDLRVAYGKNVVLMNQGWTITGDGGASTKSTFNLLSGYVEYDVDVSDVNAEINGNVYGISPKGVSSSGFAQANYCDGAIQNPFCVEMDWFEGNGNCGGATTMHTKKGTGVDGCNSWGCSRKWKNTAKQFKMKITYDASGRFSVFFDGKYVHNSTILSPKPLNSEYEIVRQAYINEGSLIYSSQWKGWVPDIEGCPKGGNLADSIYRVRNLVIKGKLVQGPAVTLCSAPTPTPAPTPRPPAPAPTPAPTPRPPAPAPTPAPAPAPTPAPAPAPTPAPTQCASLFGQCGGQGWGGPTCCKPVSCVKQSEFYSQCL